MQLKEQMPKISHEQVERAIEGLLERLCLYLTTDPDPDLEELHKMLLAWVVKHYAKEDKDATKH